MTQATDTAMDASVIASFYKKVVQQTEVLRYLGIQASCKQDEEAAWALAEYQLVIRIRLASHKTLSVKQRAQVAAAVILPKLLYIARHCW